MIYHPRRVQLAPPEAAATESPQHTPLHRYTFPISACGQREVLTVATHQNRHQGSLTHAIGVTGQHEVLMVGLYTCDPAKVVSNSKSLYWYTVKVPLSQPCFDHFFGPCFRGHDEAGLLAFSMSLFSDVGPLEAIAESKTEQKSAAKRRQRLLKAPLKPPSYYARFPTARSV